MYVASAGTLCKGLVCLGFALCRPCATQKSALGLFGVSVPPKPQQAHGDDGETGEQSGSTGIQVEWRRIASGPSCVLEGFCDVSEKAIAYDSACILPKAL